MASLILPKGIVQMTSHIQKYICRPFCDSLLEGVGVHGLYRCKDKDENNYKLFVNFHF